MKPVIFAAWGVAILATSATICPAASCQGTAEMKQTGINPFDFTSASTEFVDDAWELTIIRGTETST